MPDKRKKQLAYLYTRVSTMMQVDGFSLDAQRDRLMQAAEYHQLSVVREFSDEGISGKNTTDRPDFTKMIRLIESGNPDGVRYVLVFKLSRFARNAADVLYNLQIMQDNGVDLISVDEGIDSSGSAGKLIISVLAAVAEIERDNIQAQTKAGQQQKAREGGWNGGQIPFGYRIAKDGGDRSGRLVIDEEEADIVRLIFEKFVHSDMGYSSVARWLNDNGYRRDVRRGRKYSLFADYSVRDILDNPIYTGKIAYGRRAQEKVKGARNKYRSVRQDKYDVYDGQHEAIIDDELFRAAQEKRKAAEGKPLKHYGPKHVHLLSGILRCPVCGSPMYGRISRKKKRDGSGYNKEIPYYNCRNVNGNTGMPCSYKTSIRQEALDEEVIMIAQDALAGMGFNEDVATALGRPEDLDKLGAEMDKLLAKKKKQELKKSRLLSKILDLDAEDAQYDAIYESLEDILRRISEDISALDSRIEEIGSRIRNAEEGAASAEQMLSAYQWLIENFELWPEEEKRDILHGIFSRIELLPEPRPGGQHVKSVQFKFRVSLDGKSFGHDLDVYYDGDNDGPPDGELPSGGGTPPEDSGSPAGGVAPHQEGASSGRDASHVGKSVSNPMQAVSQHRLASSSILNPSSNVSAHVMQPLRSGQCKAKPPSSLSGIPPPGRAATYSSLNPCSFHTS